MSMLNHKSMQVRCSMD